MALTGELSDLSLAELIEFFCNQRKTGRLKVVYPIGPGYFYLLSGSVVHARIGVLRGIEAVYYCLTLPNASFNFSPAFEAPEHTINQPWTSVVLEGLRRMDEGIKPSNPFPENHQPADLPPVEDDVEDAVVEQLAPMAVAVEPEREEVFSPLPAARDTIPFLSQVESQSRFASRPWKLGLVFGSVALIVAVVAVPWGWYARGKAARSSSAAEAEQLNSQTVPAANTSAPVTEAASTNATTPATDNASSAAANEAAELARRQREAKAKEQRKAQENTGTPLSASAPSTSAPASKPASESGSKRVTVQVTYDENGRVTQASGGDPTALRIARQKRFPPGKAGSATVTIPIN
jgi:hypothetical protein